MGPSKTTLHYVINVLRGRHAKLGAHVLLVLLFFPFYFDWVCSSWQHHMFSYPSLCCCINCRSEFCFPIIRLPSFSLSFFHFSPLKKKTKKKTQLLNSPFPLLTRWRGTLRVMTYICRPTPRCIRKSQWDFFHWIWDFPAEKQTLWQTNVDDPYKFGSARFTNELNWWAWFLKH